ncbi:MAG: DsbA family oxidoreductase [Saprospiraceae bacterium]
MFKTTLCWLYDELIMLALLFSATKKPRSDASERGFLQKRPLKSMPRKPSQPLHVLRFLHTESILGIMRKFVLVAATLFSTALLAFAQNEKANAPAGQKNELTDSKKKKMQIEIWSDVVCPFCYIGKLKFEQALEKFPQKDKVEIVWKSFQLDPEAAANGEDYLQNLSERKGWSLEQTRQITENVTQMAAAVGLAYHFEKAIAANSFDAHRLSHLAHQHGLQDGMEEALFKAHFVEGKNIADRSTLVQLGTAIGLDATEVKNVLEGQAFADAVRKDIDEAQELRVSGVPFFVFDRKYAVSGAQESDVFLKTLEKALATWQEKKP